MKHIKSILEGIVSQGRLVGSRGSSFRASSSSDATGRHDHGIDIGAKRNYDHEKAAKEKADSRAAERAREVEKRNREAEQRKKETAKMASEEHIEEAKGKFVYDKPLKAHVAAMDKHSTDTLKGMHDRWASDHKDMKSNPAHSEKLLAAHHILKNRGVSVPDLPQHKNLGMTRRFTTEEAESAGTKARVKIKNVARLGDPEPTSEKSTLGKTDSIKTKIVEEKPTMSLPNFGLPASLIAAARQIVEKKHDDGNGDAKKMEGGKTAVIIDPETDDKINEGEPKKKHTTPKSAGEKKLAALAHPKDKITHKDVLVGRGVVKEEEVEELEELKKSTLGSYTKKAVADVAKRSDVLGQNLKLALDPNHMDTYGKYYKKTEKRKGMIGKAVDKLAKEEVEEVDEAIKPYVSFTAARPGRPPSATVMGPNEKPHKTFSKTEHGSEYKQKALDYFKKHGSKLKEEIEEINELGVPRRPSPAAMGAAAAKADDAEREKLKAAGKKIPASLTGVKEELSAEEIERIEAIAAQLNEAKPTVVSAPIRGANQDQAGHGTKSAVADYTISDSKKVKVKEEVELEEGRGRPRKNPLPAGQEPAGDDTHKHPMQQLEKISHAVEGNEPQFEHKDGSKSKVGKHLAKHIVAIHNSMRTSQEKDNFAQKVHANRDSMKSEVSKHF